jgi:hypothetical protein
MGGTKEGGLEGALSVSVDPARSGQDLVVNDHVGDRADQSICDRRGLCIVLSEGAEPMDEQWEGQGVRQQEEWE